MCIRDRFSDKEYYFTGFNSNMVYPDDVPRRSLMFWAEIPAKTTRLFTPMTIAEDKEQPAASPEIMSDLNGWPLKVTYGDGREISGVALAEFVSV